MTDKDPRNLFDFELEDFDQPLDDKASWTQTIRIRRPSSDKDADIEIVLKPTKPAHATLRFAQAVMANALNIGTNEFNLWCYLRGFYEYVREYGNPNLKRIIELETKMSSKQTLADYIAKAKENLPNAEFLELCKLKGIDPEQSKPKTKPSDNRSIILEWAYGHHMLKSKMDNKFAIADAIENGVILEANKPYLVKLMSQWNVSGRMYGIWDFRELSDEAIAEHNGRKIVK